jgi:quinoprotein glucose dehydrogenase
MTGCIDVSPETTRKVVVSTRQLMALLLTSLSLNVLSADDGSQFSPLEQITPENVSKMTLAFTFHTGDLGEGFARKGHSFQATPVFWNGSLFISTSSNEVFAVDAASGEPRWHFDPQLDRDLDYSESASRGVVLWHGESDTCPDRVFHGTLDGRFFAINALTGELCRDFGDNGSVDLGVGIRNRRPGEYSVTSPAAILEDRVIIGSSIGDHAAVDLEEGIVRALDPLTGTEIWRWDPIPKSQDDPAAETWEGQSADITGAANAWAPLSVDPDLRLVYVPTSSPSPDFYGGERLGENHYANSIVALDVDDGSVAWFHQLVHHDLWDYDMPAEPSLTTIRRGGREIPAVVVVTKTGMLFAFHRETGEPIYEITEKPVPQTDIPGERSHPTQPFSEIVIAPHRALTTDDAFGLMYFDKQECAAIIEQSRSEGLFTPPSFQGTLMYPSWAGGMNWGGVALDQSRQIAITNYINAAGIIKLMPLDEFRQVVSDQSMPGWQLNRMRGTPYGMARRLFVSPLDIPCTKPPWGRLAAVDLESGKILWQQTLGSAEDKMPVPGTGFIAKHFFKSWGIPALGGPLMTASGVTFLGATLDYYFRAFNSETGDELWHYRLPTSANAIPMSYMVDGRQYIAIAVGGHTNAGTPPGDSLMVFTLGEALSGR